MILSKTVSLSSISFLSLGESAKKAISEAEIIAERHKNRAEMRSAIAELIEIAEKWISENKPENESVSKMKQFLCINHESVAGNNKTGRTYALFICNYRLIIC